jgi:PIN domain nuclease of toxin-antitoxin system
VRLLLDTHVALWVLTGDSRLGESAFAMIAAPENEIFVSAVTIWEIAIKYQLRPDQVPMPPQLAIELSEASGYRLLAVQPHHAAAVGELPPIHRDPFDRLLVAQALTEPLRLMTRDRTVAAYSDTILLV